jgi:hypothetical protein
MISRLNRINLPTFREMVADLGEPSPAALARTLGLHERTVMRYRATNDAPRPVLLALFWLTSWGHEEVDHQLYTRALYAQHVRALRDEVERQRRELARVLALGDFGCANAPSWGATAAELLATSGPRRPTGGASTRAAPAGGR